METSKKRKREPDPLRITYDAETRTFDRLFKERSLEEMRAVIRKKMSLPDSTKLRLYQIRDGKSIDLEDDDDFEALAASSRISPAATIRVVINDETGPQEISKPNDAQGPPKPKKKKKKQVDADPSGLNSAPSTPLVNALSTDSPRPTKKRRVSFAEALSAPPISVSKEANKKRRLSMSDLAQSPSTSTSPEPLSISPSEQQTAATDDKKKSRKRKKKQNSPVSEANEETPATKVTSTKPSSKALGASVTEETDVEPAKKPKKRPRGDTDQSDRDVPTQTPPPPAPTQEPEQPPAKKKKAKRKNSPQNDTNAVAAVSPSSTDSVEPPKESKKEKRKKQKALTQPDAEIPASAPPPPDKTVAPTSEKSNVTPLPEDSTASKSIEADDPSKKKEKRKKKKEKAAESEKSPQAIETSAPPPVPAASDDTVPTEKVKKRKSKKGSEDTEQAPVDSSTPIGSDSSPEQQDVDDVPISAKPSKKKKKKNAETSQETAKAPPPTTVDVKEATLAAVQAIMARYQGKDASAKAPARVTENAVPEEASSVQSSPPVDAQPDKVAEKPANSAAKEAEVPPPTTPGLQRQPLNGATPKGATPKPTAPEAKSEPAISVSRKVKPASCPYCDKAPYHYRSKCKLFRGAGVRGLEERIQELEAMSDTGVEDAAREAIIKELKQEVENKAGRPYKAPEPATPAPVLSKGPKSKATPSHAVSSETSSTPTFPKEPAPPASTSKPVSAPSDSSDSEDEAPPAPTQSSTKAPAKLSTTTRAKEASQPAVKPMPILKASNSKVLSALAPFLDMGDITSYTEKDLEALIRGPPVSSRDVHSAESSEEEEEEGEKLVEDEDGEADKSMRHRGRADYASSSEEEQDEEEDRASEEVDKAPLAPPTLAREASDKSTSASDSSSSPEHFHEGNISFQEMEALGSSRELDRTGDVAFEKAYAKDVASVAGNPEFTYDDTPVMLDAVEMSVQEIREQSEESEDAIMEDATSAKPLSSTPVVDEEDPIETDDPDALQEDSAAAPESTPLPTQAEKEPTASSSVDDLGSQVEGGAENTPVGRSAKKKGALTPISELPVPPHPGTRVIRPSFGGQGVVATYTPPPAKTPARGRQRVTVVPDQTPAEETTPSGPPARVTRRSSRSAAAATPGKRVTASQPALVAEEEEEEAPRTRPRTSSRLQQRATSAQPEIVPANSVSKTPTNTGSKTLKSTVKPPSKAAGSKTPAKPTSKAPASSNKKQVDDSDATLGTQAAGNTSLASWTHLPETQDEDSQVMSDTHGLTDELLPSSNPFAGSSTHNDDEDANIDDGSSQNPLFLHSATQQSLPYSQYPDPASKPAESPNESDEEDEVEAVVQATAISAPRYRGLTELQGVKNFSKPTLRPARFEQKAVKDLYGRSGKDSDSSDGSDSSDSSSAEENKTVSHIPESRRAGAANTRRK